MSNLSNRVDCETCHKANARLIAAAPALLEALEAAEERIAELETWLVSETGQHSATYRKVRAAIAQAKGESNG